MRIDVSVSEPLLVIRTSEKMEGVKQLGALQMDGNTPCAKVIHPKHATDDIAAHAIEDQDLPDGVAIFIQDRS